MHTLKDGLEYCNVPLLCMHHLAITNGGTAVVEFATPEHASNALERFTGQCYERYNLQPTVSTLDEAPCDPALPPIVHNTNTRPGSTPDTAMAIDDQPDEDDEDDPPFSQDFNQSLLILRQACPPEYQSDLEEEAIHKNRDAQELQALVYQWVTDANQPIRRKP
eukprot:scaffold144772_cov30-Attheya_sp.AAC.2